MPSVWTTAEGAVRPPRFPIADHQVLVGVSTAERSHDNTRREWPDLRSSTTIAGGGEIGPLVWRVDAHVIEGVH